MSNACCGGDDRGRADRPEAEAPVALGLADRLALVAAPAFAIMALVSAMPGNSPTAMLCGGARSAPLGGMVVMYSLMSAFHAAPWLRLLTARLAPGRLPRGGGVGKERLAAQLAKGQGGAGRGEDFLRQGLVVDDAGEHDRPDHGGPGGDRRAPSLFGVAALRRGAEILDPPADRIGHGAAQIGGAARRLGAEA